jgi:hypothetical protein
MGSLTIVEVAEYHNDVADSLKLYFSEHSPSFGTRFFGRSPAEIAAELAARLEETDLRSAFFILASLEADFRVDYEYRCEKKIKDDLSRAFRTIYQSRRRNAKVGRNASLDEDIFETWKEEKQAPVPRLIGELRGAFKFRHWLAHGRYWEPKLGRRKYDFNFIYSLADDVLSAFPLLKFD